MQSIKTRYIAPTNTRPARIKAQCQAGSIVLTWEYGLGENENHARSCEALRSKLGWTAENGYPVMIGGHTADGMVWVFVSDIKTKD